MPSQVAPAEQAANSLKSGSLEHFHLQQIADALQLPHTTIPAVTELATLNPTHAEGMNVCFTGSAITPDGQELTRADLHALGARHGFVPLARFTKKDWEVLVAADTASSSSKAVKARR